MNKFGNQFPVFTRKLVTARKQWECAAMCGEYIMPGDDYVDDSYYDGMKTSAVLRYHFRCAIDNKKIAKDMTLKYYHELINGTIQRFKVGSR